jgi:hypothetical protein
MRWPLRTRAASSTATEAVPDRSEPVIRHSPGIQAALEKVRGEARCRVLDLGAAVASNVEMLSEFANHIRIVDLLAEDSPGVRLDELEDRALQRAAERLLPSSWGPYDLVLTWDLLNYLGEPQTKAVARRLGELCSNGAYLYALVVSAEEMPARPSAYRILDGGNLEYRVLSPGSKASPRWPPLVVERILADFRIERSFVLRHGVQEYVAVRR